MSREINFMYDKLVKNDNDFVGMNAYSIYKTQKIKYCKDFYKKNNRNLTTDELKSFHESVKSGIKNFREQAKTLNEVYQKVLFEKKSQDIIEMYKTHLP